MNAAALEVTETKNTEAAATTPSVEGKTVAQLRTIARELAVSRGDSKSWIAGSTREAIVAYIQTGIIEEATQQHNVVVVDPANFNGNGNGHSNGSGVLDMLAAEIMKRGTAKSEFDADAVRAIVREETAGLKPQTVTHTIEVKRLDGSEKSVGVQHRNFAMLLALAQLRIPQLLSGPAGTGKTHAGHAAADALGLPFYCKSVGAQTTEVSLMGYMDATGQYRGTSFRKAYEQGGVFVLDEIDAGSPAVLIVLNSALANGSCSFPDGMIQRHADFVFIGTANTLGQGATREYVGRNPIDMATLDRFAYLDWAIDLDLELAIAGLETGGGMPFDFATKKAQDVRAYVDRVRAIRKAAEELRVRMIVSPRCVKYGVEMLRAGFKMEVIESLLVWNKVDSQTADKVRNAAR